MILLAASLVGRIVLAGIFIVAGWTKLANLDRSAELLAGFGISQNHLKFLAVALPLVELGVAAALIIPATAFAGALAASALLAMFTIVIAFHLSRGRRPACNCFGQLSSDPIGPRTLVRNLVLMGVAILIVAGGPDAAPTWQLDELFGLTRWEVLAAAAMATMLLLLFLIAAMQAMILRHLTPQSSGQDAPAAFTNPRDSSGLPEGSLAPSFGLIDTRGDFVTLEQLLVPGLPVILFFTKPDCPPCAALAKEVDRWQEDHAGLIEIVRITDGMAAVENYALLQARGEVAQTYDCWGTPCALLITPDGHIGSAAAQGAAAIRALVRRVAAGAKRIA